MVFAASIQLGTSQSSSAASIDIGGTAIALGAPQDKVLASLAGKFDLEEQGTGGASWLVYEKRAPRWRPVANVYFKAGHLQYARRYWSPDDKTAAAPFATAVFGAISHLVSEGRRACVLDVGATQNPKADIKTASINCGAKGLEITVTHVTQGLVGVSATIDEVIDGRE
jgi:hypothetical protein